MGLEYADGRRWVFDHARPISGVRKRQRKGVRIAIVAPAMLPTVRKSSRYASWLLLIG